MEKPRRRGIQGSATRRDRVAGFYCESLREAGTLSMVFALLDVVIGGATVSAWTIGFWCCAGLLLLVLGVHVDPEVRP
jgi:hypothetical protein